MLFSSRNWWKRTYWQRFYFWGKKTKSTRKKLGCDFITINTSNAKNGYDVDYEVGNIEAFIDEFKNKKNCTRKKKVLENKNKEQENKIKEIKDKNKELKKKAKKLTNNQITNNFGKIIIKNW